MLNMEHLQPIATRCYQYSSVNVMILFQCSLRYLLLYTTYVLYTVEEHLCILVLGSAVFVVFTVCLVYKLAK